jgi:hypothetical protein
MFGALALHVLGHHQRSSPARVQRPRRLDFTGTEACAARELAVCRIGPYSLPFDVCEERAYTPGLLANILTGDTSFLEPEAESPPLACAPSTP